MSFGKRDPNGIDSMRELGRQANAASAVKKPTARQSGGNGGMDAAFIALTLGVVLIAGGGAFVAPSLMSWVSGSFGAEPVRPIPDVVAGLSRDDAKAALAKGAFPDKPARAFMTRLAADFPSDHDKLLGGLADSAMKGGDRDALTLDVNTWAASFTMENLPAIGRTGARGFDEALTIGSDALSFIEKTAGGNCSSDALMAFVSDPQKILDLGAYGSDGWKLNMQTYETLVGLAAAGRSAPAIDTTLTPQDEQALQSVFMSIMMDERVMTLMQTAMRGDPSQVDLDSSLNICELGRTVIGKLKSLPSGTKDRLWALGVSEAAKAIRTMPPGALASLQ
jgi:hypothetical protein